MHPHFFSCDWGTSHFRLRLVETASRIVLAEIKTGEGAAHLSQQTTADGRAALFAETLSRHATSILRETGSAATACVVSGMASSSIGWVDLPYALAPMPLAPENFVTHTLQVSAGTAKLQVTLVSGVRTGDDVIRGEECELYGLMELHPDLGSAQACVLLPGTHSKHIQIEGRELKGFLTYMTGELFAHLRGLPTLRAPLSAEGETFEPEFRKGVLAAQRFGLAAGLFKIRSRALISPQAEQHAPSFLSGLLIGAELMSLQMSEAKVFVAGSPNLHPLYKVASEQIGLPLLFIAPDILQQSLLHAHQKLISP